MTSFLGWRQAFESAGMLRDRSAFCAGTVRPMTCPRRSLHKILAGAAVGAITLGGSAVAADLPLKAPQYGPAFDWSGFYVGGHSGYSRGSSSAVLSDPQVAASSGHFSGVMGG